MLASWTMAERESEESTALLGLSLLYSQHLHGWNQSLTLNLELCLQDYGPPSPEDSPWVCCLSFPIYPLESCKHTSLWSPESENVETSPVAASKIGGPEKGISSLLREGWAGVRQRRSRERFHQPSLPEGSLQTSRSMSEWNPALQAEALGQAKEPLPQKDLGCVSVCSLARTGSPIVTAPWDSGMQAPLTLPTSSQAIKECLPATAGKTRTPGAEARVPPHADKSFPLEILVLWSSAEGLHEDHRLQGRRGERWCPQPQQGRGKQSTHQPPPQRGF